MKNTLALLLITCLTFIGTGQVQAQTEASDTIFKVNNETIVCMVLEFNTTEVKYAYADRPNLVLAIENELVDYIRLKTGEIIRPIDNEKAISDLAYDKQKTMNLKFGLLTPLQGYTDFGFEYSKKPLHSLEGSLGIIGLGSNDFSYTKDRGVTASFGYRVFAKPDFHLRKVRNAHRMGGLYVQPTLAFSYHISEGNQFIYDPVTFDYNEEMVRSEVVRSALLLKMGKQYIFGEVFSVDLNVGVGYGFVNSRRLDGPDEDPYYVDYDFGYGFNVIDYNGLALSSSLKIGVLIK